LRCNRGGPWLCGQQDLFEVAQVLHAREPWLGCPGLAAGGNVQHPEWDLQNPTSLDVFQAAVRHRLAPLYEAGMHPHCLAMPWMPRIADFTDVSNMGVVLLSCIIRNAIIRERGTCCSSLPRRQRHAVAMFTAANDSEACFDTIAGRLNNLTIRRELRVTGLLSYRASRSGKANAHCPSNAHRVRRWQALAIRLRLELPKLVAAWRLAQTADHPVDRPAQRFAEALGYWTVSPARTLTPPVPSLPP